MSCETAPGLADPQALTLAVSTFQAVHFIGKPECEVRKLETLGASYFHLFPKKRTTWCCLCSSLAKLQYCPTCQK